MQPGTEQDLMANSSIRVNDLRRQFK